MRVKELAASIHAAWEGDGEREILRVASLEDAGPGGDALSFVTRGRAAKNAGDSQAACLLVPEDYPNPANRTLI
ncbi:MAG: LpxD N-terminal domain-containing protein, partial [Candidatus Sulfotelmatobacter sp.]